MSRNVCSCFNATIYLNLQENKHDIYIYICIYIYIYILMHAISPCHFLGGLSIHFFNKTKSKGLNAPPPSPCCFSTSTAPEKSRQPMSGCQVTHVGESWSSSSSSWLTGKPKAEQPKKMSGSCHYMKLYG